MFDHFVIISKAGAILYWYNPQQSSSNAISSSGTSSTGSLSEANDGNARESLVELLNQFLDCVFLSCSPSQKAKYTDTKMCTFPVTYSSTATTTSMVAEWEDGGWTNSDDYYKDWIALLVYKPILHARMDHRSLLALHALLRRALVDYAAFHRASTINHQIPGPATSAATNQIQEPWRQHLPPPPHILSEFHATFLASYKKLEELSYSQQQLLPSLEISRRTTGSAAAATNGQTAATTTTTKSTTAKKQTMWYDSNKKVSAQMMESLDRSKEKKVTSAVDLALQEAKMAYLPSESDLLEGGEEHTSEESQNIDNRIPTDDITSASTTANLFFGSTLEGAHFATTETSKDGSASSSTWYYSLWERVTGNKVLTKQDVQPILDEMKQILISKNVAQETAQVIVQDVSNKLVGTKLSSMTRIKTIVRLAVEQSVARILNCSSSSTSTNPLQHSVDLLQQVLYQKQQQNPSKQLQRRPYVIVVVGINGVGKSTTLAKLAYYFRTSGCSVALAACDTFRSGAVEQLQVHATTLQIPLYQRGYAKDPSAVAKAAIYQATTDSIDVLLIDTAGRMQNNVPLMKSLGKLVEENQPDCVIMVAEALVGNDGINQLQMFDQAIQSSSTLFTTSSRRGNARRGLDGIILTKFDTVSEKVGAAITMSHLTGKPILFVGTGQKYHHLKQIHVPSIIQSLFS